MNHPQSPSHATEPALKGTFWARLLAGACLPLQLACSTSPTSQQQGANQTPQSVSNKAQAMQAVPATKGNYSKPPAEELRKRLSDTQYQVTQENGTEPPFRNEYWNNKKEGLYVDIVSGEPLFASNDKFASGTGWPSFTKPIEKGRVVNVSDGTHGMVRTEVRSSDGDSHLGHVFNDGPAPTGLRYCINSASLRFVPVADLAKEGYAAYLPLFQRQP